MMVGKQQDYFHAADTSTTYRWPMQHFYIHGTSTAHSYVCPDEQHACMHIHLFKLNICRFSGGRKKFSRLWFPIKKVKTM